MKIALATLAASALALTPAASAATIAASIAVSSTGNAANFNVTLGWAFTLEIPVLVSDLGFWDNGSNGLAGAQTVDIWTSAGVLKVTGIVPAGTGAPLLNSFRYISVTPVALPAGSYTIGAYSNGSPDLVAISPIITTDAAVTYAGSRSAFTSGIGFPSGDTLSAPGGNSYFGPNFQFTATAPEPASAALLGLGTLLLAAHRRRSTQA